jgi:hypothetical protein
MGKIHELLAVEPDLKAEAARVISEAKSLFSEGVGRLQGFVKKYVPLEDGGDTFPEEAQPVATTVSDTMAGIEAALGKFINAAIQKEISNTAAVADVIIDEEVLLENMPATALLNLEARLGEFRSVVAIIPTLDPGMKWAYDEQLGVYVTEPQEQYRTKKVPRAQVMYEATVEHPAQVEQYFEDVRVGELTTTHFSGRITAVAKEDLLERVDALARAVKQARQRANDTEASNREVSATIFEYLSN